MTTIFTVTAVKALIYKTLEEDYGVTPTGGTLTTGSGGSGGLTQAQVQQLIDTAIAKLPAPGVSQAQVDSSIATALAGLPPAGITQAQVETAIATALAGLPVPLSESQVNDLIAAALAGGLSEGQVQTLIEAALANLPDPAVGVTLAQVEAAVADAIAAVPAQVDAQIQAALAGIETFGPDEAQQVSDAVSLAQGVVNILGGKPDGGGTLADVAAVFGNLGATFEAQIEQATVEANANVQALIDAITGTPGSTAQDVADRFAMMAQAIGEAIQSGMKALPDKITLNVKSDNATDKVTIASHQLTPHPPTEARAVDVDVAPYGDGTLTVKGKRVLTVDDAIDPSGVDAAAVEAAVAPLAAELAKKADTAYVQEQFGNFNDLLQADITGVAQEVLKKADKTVVDSLTADLNQGLQLLQNEYNQIANDIIQWVITDYTTKAEFQALLEAIGGSTVEEVAELFRGLNDGIAAMVDQAFVDKSPGLVAAIADYLSINLGLFFPANAATKDDIEAAKTDILKSLAGGKVVTDKPWTTCPPASTGAGTNSTGWLSARVLNGIVTLRGDVMLNNPLPTTDGWVTIRNLPPGFPPPEFVVASAINGYVSGTRYVPAGIRVTNDGALQVIATSEPTKGFNFTGLMYQAF